MKVSPPIRFRIEWADSQGKVTASWLAAHFNLRVGMVNLTQAGLRAAISHSFKEVTDSLQPPDNSCVAGR